MTGGVPENANGHERQGARTSGVAHRHRGRPVTEPLLTSLMLRKCITAPMQDHRLRKNGYLMRSAFV